jgi:DNA-binding beta-propeller fold protein YncE
LTGLFLCLIIDGSSGHHLKTAPYTVRFKPDGTKMFVTGSTGDDINEYSLSTAWDITTATLTKQKLSIYSDFTSAASNYDTLTEPRYYGAGTSADIEGLAVSKDGTNILIAHNNNWSEYKLPV